MDEKRFNPAHLERLDNPERRRLLPPERLLESLNIQRDDTILDVGAGTGYFAIPAAKLTDRTVYALDVEQKMLDVLQTKLSEEQLENVTLLKGAIEDIPLDDLLVDHVIASLVMHEVEPISQGISELRRVLKPGGQCFCLEWEKTLSESGPPLHHRIHSSDMEKAFEEAGFTLVSIQFPTDAHYLLIVRK